MKKLSLLLLLICGYAAFGLAQGKHITILHTNDVHSQVEPDKNNMGGMVRMATYIRQVRAAEENVLLLSAGDMFQGTPYYNLFSGAVEIELMNAMGYDLACLGNHEFDNGIDSLVKRLQEAKFKIITANYDVSETALRPLVKPYAILEKGGFKIGVVGVGTDLSPVSFGKNWEGIVISDAVEAANTIAKQLKEQHCDLVLCLSHIGYEEDIKLAENSRNIDLIIGGHSHTFLEKPDIRKNLDGKDVPITQTGGNGKYIGRIDIRRK
ncbi:MAG: metallophosphatase [Prevotellaceae bacterium]|jgi:5'-nucleotidase|nr:metallophosphatase [Prevotellaceae bacterium]